MLAPREGGCVVDLEIRLSPVTVTDVGGAEVSDACNGHTWALRVSGNECLTTKRELSSHFVSRRGRDRRIPRSRHRHVAGRRVSPCAAIGQATAVKGIVLAGVLIR